MPNACAWHSSALRCLPSCGSTHSTNWRSGWLAYLRDQIEVMVRDEFREFRRATDTERQQLRTQKTTPTDERVRLLQAHYAGAVPLDLLKTEQERIGRQLSANEGRLTATDVEVDRFESARHAALEYATNWSKGYMRAGQHERRLSNQAFFSRFEVKDDELTSEFAEPFRTLFDAEVAEAAVLHTVAAENADNHQESAPSLTDALIRENKPAPGGADLKQALLVPLLVPPA
ncbi:MAG: site-specific recombinase [Mycobacterium sp.]|nr:site-specific recombinase [Mycobacterium sp.]